jgi:3-oxoacyl-[acyl-carrier-protein] synthase III
VEAKELYIQTLTQAYDYMEENEDTDANDKEDLKNAIKESRNAVYHVRIAGVGQYLPKRIVTNEEVEQLCNVKIGWSKEHKVGVETRRWADYLGKEPNSMMGAEAVKDACKNASISLTDCDCLINASAGNERILPDGSCLVKRALGLEGHNMACFSTHSTCLSFVLGMDLAASLIASKRYKRVIVVSSEVASVACNFEQPESAILLGDGEVACILESSPAGSKSMFLNSHFENYCEGLETATVKMGTTSHPRDPTTMKNHLFDMDGQGIISVIHKYGAGFLEKLRPGLSTRLPLDIDLVIPHQPSGKALELLESYGWPRDKIVRIIDYTGNCVASSTGMALYEAISSGRLQRGEKALIVGTGGGITFGGITFVY